MAGELERRREFGYPPYSSLLAVEMASAEGRRLLEAADRVAARLDAALPAVDVDPQ